MLRYYGPADQFKESSSKVLNTSTTKHLFWNFASYFVFIPGPRGKKLFVDYNYTQFFFPVCYNLNFAFTELLRQIFKNDFREMIPAVRKLSYWLSKALNLEYSLKLNLRILNIEKRRNCIVQWIYINSFLALFFSFSSLWVKAWPSLQLNWKSWRSEKIPISSHAFLNMRFKTLHLSLIIFLKT